MRPLCSAILFLSLGASLSGAEPPTYRVVDIGSLVGMSTFATALNEQGQVVGHSAVGDFQPHVGTPYHAFLYSDGAMVDLDPGNEFWSSFAADIGEDGKIVGSVQREGLGYSQPFLYSETEGIDILNPLDVHPLLNTGAAHGINEAGQIVGTAGSQAFLLTPPGPTGQALATGGGTGLNDLGVVVGTLKPSPWSSEEHGFVYENGTLQNLDDLRLVLGETGTTFAPSAVNENGNIVGTLSGPEVITQASVLAFGVVGWPWNDLGVLDGARSYGNGINADGDVVGTLHPLDPAHPWRAFVWLDGEMHVLNDLLAGDPGVFLTEGMAINDAGQIVARGHSTSEPELKRSYLLTPADPVGLIEELAGFIEGLEIHEGIENALLVKLHNALAALEAGSLSEACDLLGAFVNQVEAQAGKKLADADAAQAIGQARAIREMLGCL